MQVNKKAIAVKAGVIFIAVMIFFTLASRTICYYMTPKVTIDRPNGGYFTTSHNFEDAERCDNKGKLDEKGNFLRVKLSDEQKEIFEEDLSCYNYASGAQITGSVSGFVEEEKQKYMIMRLDEKLDEVAASDQNASVGMFGKGGKPPQASKPVQGGNPEQEGAAGSEISVTVEAKSDFYNVIIPKSALIFDKEVFVLEMRMGFWGEEYFAVKKEVEIGDSDNFSVQITGGIREFDTLITGWDREIQDGMRVMLPLD